MKRLMYALALTPLIGGALSAKDDPFSGKWTLNKAKSKVAGEQRKMEDLDNKKLKFTMGNGDTDTVPLDGKDQPVHYGRTLALTTESPTCFKMVVKKDGKMLSSMTHTLSDDGNTQTIKGTDYRPDGTTSEFEVIDKRVGGGSGWTGTWESTKVKFNSPAEFEIVPNGKNGIAFKSQTYKASQKIKFDGKSYPAEGPEVPPGLTTSGKRTSEHSFELTDNINGKVVGRSTFEVAGDGKTLTITSHDPGQPNTATYVYDKI